MIVKVKASFTPECWYSEMIDQSFMAFAIQGSPFLWFDETHFFFPQDVVVEPNPKTIFFPMFNVKAAA